MRAGILKIARVNQTMNQPARGGGSPYVRTFPPGSTVWICPRSGRYRFAIGGGGGGADGSTGGGGGAHAQKVRRCAYGEAVTLQVASTVSVNNNGGASTLTFADGSVVTAGGGASGGNGGAGGVASGGDININGAAASGATGGLGGSSGLFGGRAGDGAPTGSFGSLSSIGQALVLLEGP